MSAETTPVGPVVVGIDGSEASLVALRHGIREADWRGVDAHVVHVLDVTPAVLHLRGDVTIDTRERAESDRAEIWRTVEPILDDAVDLLERKIQLLAARGWFEETEHRRNALDRLLPTIRAAADPITRELYLTRVAERTGVSKIVLEQELRLQPRRYAGPPAERQSAPPAIDPVPVESDGVRAEEELLRVLVRSPEWRERARELMRAEHFDLPAHRELFEALMALPPNEPAAQLPPSLSHSAQLKWISLREAAERLAGADVDATFTATTAALLSRPERREIDRIMDPIERRRRLDDLLRRYGKVEQARWIQRAVRKRK